MTEQPASAASATCVAPAWTRPASQPGSYRSGCRRGGSGARARDGWSRRRTARTQGGDDAAVIVDSRRVARPGLHPTPRHLHVVAGERNEARLAGGAARLEHPLHLVGVDTEVVTKGGELRLAVLQLLLGRERQVAEVVERDAAEIDAVELAPIEPGSVQQSGDLLLPGAVRQGPDRPRIGTLDVPLEYPVTLARVAAEASRMVAVLGHGSLQSSNELDRIAVAPSLTVPLRPASRARRSQGGQRARIGRCAESEPGAGRGFRHRSSSRLSHVATTTLRWVPCRRGPTTTSGSVASTGPLERAGGVWAG